MTPIRSVSRDSVLNLRVGRPDGEVPVTQALFRPTSLRTDRARFRAGHLVAH